MIWKVMRGRAVGFNVPNQDVLPVAGIGNL